MTDSAASPIITVESPAAPAPMAPVIESVTFTKKKATIELTMPATDTDGGALTTLINIKIFFALSGSDLSAVTPAEFPGEYAPGSHEVVEVEVPEWGKAYDFEAKVSD